MYIIIPQECAYFTRFVCVEFDRRALSRRGSRAGTSPGAVRCMDATMAREETWRKSAPDFCCVVSCSPWQREIGQCAVSVHHRPMAGGSKDRDAKSGYHSIIGLVHD